MASSRELKRRIKTAGNISKITKAMEAVAASKMRKAQDISRAGHGYETSMRAMVEHVLRYAPPSGQHPFFRGEADETDALSTLTILLSPDRGLCGSLNSGLFRMAEKAIAQHSPVVTVGKKAYGYAQKTSWKVIGSIEKLGDKPQFEQTLPASSIAIQEFTSRNVSKIQLMYPKFINTLSQQTVLEVVLPLSHVVLSQGEAILRPLYIFEPSGSTLLTELLPAYVRLSVFQAVLSMKAAEHSARMVAMKSASENADAVREQLALQHNKNRQKTITAEISDIVTATMAMG